MLISLCPNSLDPKESRYSVPVLSVKRKFKLKNTGLTPVFVSGYEIEGQVKKITSLTEHEKFSYLTLKNKLFPQSCENHGFKVLNCDPVTLEPGEQIDVDIAFSPDFTLSKVSRILTIQTTLSPKKSQLQFNLLVRNAISFRSTKKGSSCRL